MSETSTVEERVARYLIRQMMDDKEVLIVTGRFHYARSFVVGMMGDIFKERGFVGKTTNDTLEVEGLPTLRITSLGTPEDVAGRAFDHICFIAVPTPRRVDMLTFLMQARGDTFTWSKI